MPAANSARAALAARILPSTRMACARRSPGSPRPRRGAAITDGGGGARTDVWFLQLDACVDDMLADDFDDRAPPPYFLDRVNDPHRLKDYLESLVFHVSMMTGSTAARSSTSRPPTLFA